MRTVSLMSAALTLFVSAPLLAQGLTWTEYESRPDFFSVNFPGEPTIDEFTYPTEYRITLPGRVYRFDTDTHSYSATVIDYTDAVEIHLARNDACRGAGGDGDLCDQRDIHRRCQPQQPPDGAGDRSAGAIRYAIRGPRRRPLADDPRGRG